MKCVLFICAVLVGASVFVGIMLTVAFEAGWGVNSNLALIFFPAFVAAVFAGGAVMSIAYFCCGEERDDNYGYGSSDEDCAA